ncbi:MAG: hypothetical protein ACLRVN_06040 [Butyricicoccus sp.]
MAHISEYEVEELFIELPQAAAISLLGSAIMMVLSRTSGATGSVQCAQAD